MKANPTPRPWMYSRVMIPFNGWEVLQNPGKGFGPGICRLPAARPEDEANAKLIVRAVNSHEELLAALEGLFEHCAMTHKHWGENCNIREADAAQVAARAAIAKAKGQP